MKVIGDRAVARAYVGVDDAAAYLGVSKRWMYTEGDSNGVPCFRFGRSRRYTYEALDAWAQAQREAVAFA